MLPGKMDARLQIKAFADSLPDAGRRMPTLHPPGRFGKGHSPASYSGGSSPLTATTTGLHAIGMHRGHHHALIAEAKKAGGTLATVEKR
jgi:hypothetical protein